MLVAVSALWQVVAIYFLGDISAHFNPATTLSFALRWDTDRVMAGICWVVWFAVAVCGSLLARVPRASKDPGGRGAQPGLSWRGH